MMNSWPNKIYLEKRPTYQKFIKIWPQSLGTFSKFISAIFYAVEA